MQLQSYVKNKRMNESIKYKQQINITNTILFARVRMDNKYTEFQQNLSFLLNNNQIRQVLKQKPQKNQDLLQYLYQKFCGIIQSKVHQAFSYGFSKIKHNMKSMRNRELIYQAIFKSTQLKNQSTKKIEQQMQSTINTPQTKKIRDSDENTKQLSNHVEIVNKPESVKQFTNVKFQTFRNTPRRNSFANGNEFQIKKIVSKCQQSEQKLRNLQHIKKKNNQLRVQNIDSNQIKSQFDKTQQIYFVRNNLRRSKKDKIIRQVKVSFVIDNYNLFQGTNLKSKNQNQFDQKNFQNSIMSKKDQQNTRKNRGKLDFDLKLDLSKFKEYQKWTNASNIECKYCSTINKAKRLVSMHSGRTSTENSSSAQFNQRK